MCVVRISPVLVRRPPMERARLACPLEGNKPNLLTKSPLGDRPLVGFEVSMINTQRPVRISPVLVRRPQKGRARLEP